MDEKMELLQRLMSCKAVSSQVENVNSAVTVMKDFLESHKVYCTVETLNGRMILYASTQPGKIQDVLLNSHLDVVPATDELFTLRQEDGILRGRGVGDDQGPATCLAHVLTRLVNQCSLGVIFSTDEEIGGETTKYMIDHGYAARKLAIIVDGDPYAVGIAQKGIIELKLTAHGVGGHASAPWGCDNPIDKLLDGYSKFRAAWPKVDKENQWCDTMTPCILQAGVANNQIPDDASMIVNIRFTKLGDIDRIVKFAAVVSGLEATVITTALPFESDPQNPLIQAFCTKMQEYFPEQKISQVKMNGATDARHMVSMGVPIAVIGFGWGDIHSPKEWAKADDLTKAIDLLTDFIKNLSSSYSFA